MKMTELTVNSQFARLGNYCFLLGLWLIISIIASFIPYVGYLGGIVLLALIIRIYVLSKRLNEQLQNENFAIWRSKFLISYILFVLFNYLSLIMSLFLNILLVPSDDLEASMGVLIILLTFLVIIFVLLIIIGILQMKAWENLNIFFTENRDMFPEIYVISALNGTKKLRTAGKLTMLGFLIITLFIAYILTIIGFFKLGTLRHIEDVSDEIPTAPAPPVPAVAAPPETPKKREPETARVLQFCGNCGTKLDPSWNVCTECGTPVGGEVAHQPPPGRPHPQEVIYKKESKTFGSLALAFGIISFCCCCGFIFGPLAILFGILGLFKDDNRTLAIIGLVFGIIGAICGFIFFFLFFGNAFFIGPS